MSLDSIKDNKAGGAGMDSKCGAGGAGSTGRPEMLLDMVNHPPHYNSGKIEVIQIMEDQLTPTEYRGYIKGQVLKYITRESHKNGLEDLKKAEWYLNRLIKYLEEKRA